MTADLLCPCFSNRLYQDCCKPFHSFRVFPVTADLLMRSRYSAYKLGLSDYIIETTHPEHPDKARPRSSWKKEILQFSRSTKFLGLIIISYEDRGSEAEVLFHARLFQGDKDVSFQERSYFERIKDKWLYKSGIIIN